jgi:dUTPase
MTSRIFQIRINRLSSTARFPERISDFSFDLFSDQFVTIPRTSIWHIRTGIEISVPRDLFILIEGTPNFPLTAPIRIAEREITNVVNHELIIGLSNLATFPIFIRRGDPIARLVFGDPLTNIEHRYELVHFENITDIVNCLINREIGL